MTEEKESGAEDKDELLDKGIKIFMGDVGSTFLGSIYIFMALNSHGLRDLATYFLLATPLLADTIGCLLFRLRRGQDICV